MSRHRFPLAASLALVLAAAVAPRAEAIDRHAFSVGLQGAVGGSVGGDPDTGLDNLGVQAVFSWQSELRTYVVARAGRLTLDADDGGFDLESDLSWLTVSGEYRFTDAAWDSGLFVGLGLYQEDDDLFGDDSGIGLTLGTTARFPVADRLDVLLELAGHLTELDRAETFVTGSVGVGFKF